MTTKPKPSRYHLYRDDGRYIRTVTALSEEGAWDQAPEYTAGIARADSARVKSSQRRARRGKLTY